MLGVGFHFGIAILMGLWSFAFVMSGGLLLLLAPRGELIDWLRHSLRRRRGTSSREASESIQNAAVIKQ